MAMCTTCLQGLCRRHPLQDHGRREKAIKEKLESVTGGGSTGGAGGGLASSRTSFGDLIKAQIERLESEKKGTAEEENDRYRRHLDEQRAKEIADAGSSAHKKKHKEAAALHPGLRADVAALLMSSSDSDYDSDSSSRSSSSDTSSSSSRKDKETDRTKHSSKKRKRKEKTKEKKKKSSSKKVKKEKKAKKEKKSKKPKKATKE